MTGGLKSSECLHILVRCMKNIEAKVKEIGELDQTTQDNQIKGGSQLIDFIESMQFYNKNFGKLERDNKEEKINELEENTSKMDKNLMI